MSKLISSIQMYTVSDNGKNSNSNNKSEQKPTILKF